ncbi:hypothetical protein H9P43_007527 [Blastocladiella emersonii ATCC 22665]|nr:hypothetical protein H9P43_007527 [Blastocladiella emersonii ATCC 22665]
MDTAPATPRTAAAAAAANITRALPSPPSPHVKAAAPRPDAKARDKPWMSFIAGAVAGSVEITLTYPTEFTKTQLQLPETPFTSPVHVLRHYVTTHGVASIYTGLAPMVAGTAAKASVRFLTYDTLKQQLASTATPKSLVPLVAGLGAGVAEAVLVVTPSEVLKTHMVDAHRATGVAPSASATLRSIGVRGLWQGTLPVVARQAANSAVRFGAYGFLREHLAPGVDHPAMTFARGMVAGTVTVYATMPLDVVKTKMQARDARARYAGSGDCVLKTVREEGGVTALWRGATPRLSRLMFSGAIVFTVYEEVMRVLRAVAE